LELEAGTKERPSGDVVVGVRPEHLLPVEGEVDGRPRLRGVIDLVRPMAAKTIVDVRLEGGTTVRALTRGIVRGEPGEPVTLAFDPMAVVLFDRSTGLRID
jgi:glycerol transport system ATP-binding protein